MGEFPQNLGVGHSTGEIFQRVINGDAQAANTRFSAPFARLDGDDAGVIHIRILYVKKNTGARERERRWGQRQVKRESGSRRRGRLGDVWAWRGLFRCSGGGGR